MDTPRYIVVAFVLAVFAMLGVPTSNARPLRTNTSGHPHRIAVEGNGMPIVLKAGIDERVILTRADSETKFYRNADENADTLEVRHEDDAGRRTLSSAVLRPHNPAKPTLYLGPKLNVQVTNDARLQNRGWFRWFRTKYVFRMEVGTPTIVMNDVLNGENRQVAVSRERRFGKSVRGILTIGLNSGIAFVKDDVPKQTMTR